ncbi:hypothetical protein P3W45_001786 [Vairimorpha bombi]
MCYRISPQIKRFVKALISLSFVRYNEVQENYNLLRRHVDYPNDLNVLYSYFYDKYIREDARFSRELWHSRNIIGYNIPKTNNAIEGWHRTFNSTFGSSKYSFPLIVYRMKNEEDVIRIKSIQMDILGHVFERKKL